MGGGEECCFQHRLVSAGGGHVAQGNSALLRRPDGHSSVLQPQTVPHLPTLIDHVDFFNPTFSSLMIISPAFLELFISVPAGVPLHGRCWVVTLEPEHLLMLNNTSWRYQDGSAGG